VQTVQEGGALVSSSRKRSRAREVGARHPFAGRRARPRGDDRRGAGRACRNGREEDRRRPACRGSNGGRFSQTRRRAAGRSEAGRQADGRDEPDQGPPLRDRARRCSGRNAARRARGTSAQSYLRSQICGRDRLG
jgi:hypothetical protein